MTPSIRFPIPIPFPNEASAGLETTVIHHRDTETQSHRKEGPQITRMNTDDSSQLLLSGRRGAGRASENDAPNQEIISVFLCAPLCLCGEEPISVPQIGADR
jgi:hypothetical protein